MDQGPYTVGRSGEAGKVAGVKGLPSEREGSWKGGSQSRETFFYSFIAAYKLVGKGPAHREGSSSPREYWAYLFAYKIPSFLFI